MAADMSIQPKDSYEFGPFRLDVSERVLLREGRPVALTPKAIETLIVLVRNNGHIVEKDDLMKEVWPDAFVEEANIARNVSVLRKVLRKNASKSQYIETIPKRGYRFTGDVKEGWNKDDLVVEQHVRARLIIEEEGKTSGRDEQWQDLIANANAALTSGESKAFSLVTDSAAPVGRFNRRAFVAVLAIVILVALGYYLSRKQTAAPTPIKSIAVLPFKPLVAESRDEALEMGMADTLITKLGNIKQIIVRPISAVRKYTGLEQDSIAAGREQTVDAVLDGSIQKSREQIRITMRLVRVADGQQLWADKFEDKFTDIFAVQDLISERVAGALAVKLTGEERELLTKRYTNDTGAYQLYLLGRYYWSKRTEEGLKKGVEYFQQAVEKDPRNALAYADLAASYKAMPYYGVLPPMEAHPKAKEAATRALEIDETLAEAHAARANILDSSDWDWSAAEREFKRAIELKPNYATAHHWYGLFLERMGRLEEAKVEMTRALELDPVSLIINKNMADPYYFMREYDRAIEQYQKTLELDPNFSLARLWLGQSYEQKGMYEKAIVEFQKARLTDDNPAILAALGHAYAVSGNRGEAEKIINELKRLSKRYVAPYHIATIYAGLQIKDEAFQWLEKAYQGRDEWLLYLEIDPRLDSLRSDLRFRDLLRRMNRAS